jgi:starch synthase
VVLTRSIRRVFHKGISVARVDDNAAGQVSVDDDDDDDLDHITSETVRAAIRKSKEVLAKHKVIMEQVLFYMLL